MPRPDADLRALSILIRNAYDMPLERLECRILLEVEKMALDHDIEAIEEFPIKDSADLRLVFAYRPKEQTDDADRTS